MIRFRSKDTLMKIEEILDQAIDGKRTETVYDESDLSKILCKLNKFIDVTEVKNKKLLGEKDKVKALISDISHQTKTPIANLKLYSDLLLEKNDLPEEAIKLMKEISGQSEKLNFLIQQLIKSSRLETGIIQVTTTRNSVDKMIEEVIGQVAQKANQKNIEIDYVPVDLEVIFDYKWTSEAIHNMVENGIKYTQNNGKIKIEVEKYSMMVRINVIDNGRGIKESERSKVFSRFFRSTEVSDIEGVGIGLYLAREIIEQQGGYIKVDSKLGEGSKFSVFLPL